MVDYVGRPVTSMFTFAETVQFEPKQSIDVSFILNSLTLLPYTVRIVWN